MGTEVVDAGRFDGIGQIKSVDLSVQKGCFLCRYSCLSGDEPCGWTT